MQQLRHSKGNDADGRTGPGSGSGVPSAASGTSCTTAATPHWVDGRFGISTLTLASGQLSATVTWAPRAGSRKAGYEVRINGRALKMRGDSDAAGREVAEHFLNRLAAQLTRELDLLRMQQGKEPIKP